jgi:hypothetical protein
MYWTVSIDQFETVPHSIPSKVPPLNAIGVRLTGALIRFLRVTAATRLLKVTCCSSGNPFGVRRIQTCVTGVNGQSLGLAAPRAVAVVCCRAFCQGRGNAEVSGATKQQQRRGNTATRSLLRRPTPPPSPVVLQRKVETLHGSLLD